MSSPRKFDHDECRRLFATGRWTKAALARKYGVTDGAIARVVVPGLAAWQVAFSRAWRTGTCETCGGPAMRLLPGSSKPSIDGRTLCHTCRFRERRERLRFDERGALLAVRCSALACANVERWQPPENFPGGPRFRDVREGGIHHHCRACNTAIRRAYREKHRVPCSHGCGRMVLHETAHGGPPSCHPCAMKRAAA